MSTQTSEKAFETYVEQMLLAKGWQQDSVSEWDQERALFPLGERHDLDEGRVREILTLSR